MKTETETKKQTERQTETDRQAAPVHLEFVAECFTLLDPHLLGPVLLLALCDVGPQLLQLLHLAVQLGILISATDKSAGCQNMSQDDL